MRMLSTMLYNAWPLWSLQESMTYALSEQCYTHAKFLHERQHLGGTFEQFLRRAFRELQLPTLIPSELSSQASGVAFHVHLKRRLVNPVATSSRALLSCYVIPVPNLSVGIRRRLLARGRRRRRRNKWEERFCTRTKSSIALSVRDSRELAMNDANSTGMQAKEASPALPVFK
jgi:hypothetical protein